MNVKKDGKIKIGEEKERDIPAVHSTARGYF
jgi:hypothetical protein